MKLTTLQFTMLLLLMLIPGMTTSVHAQVTIGSGTVPDNSALLDLKENSLGTSTKGLLLPRVALQSESSPVPMANHIAGMIVYNSGTAIAPGLYINNGSKWMKLSMDTNVAAADKWFYMPSIAIDVSKSGTFSHDLYLEYRKQFDDSKDNEVPPECPNTGTPLIRSTSAPIIFSEKIEDKNELYYYVTGYDPNVFSNISISENGMMEYTVDAEKVSDKTFMNIVLLKK